ncbi:MAG: hypothetical protein M1282_12880, partial [Chloroflexi bacterium]|nr:hypothetical protein [Chloroflexota bacterium]
MPFSNDLFKDSGAKGILDYLQSRLDARDLSSEEALAMLGAVHEELSRGQPEDRSIYRDYSGFMEALHDEMPDVHDYVVSAWAERGVKDTSQETDSDDAADEGEGGAEEAGEAPL